MDSGDTPTLSPKQVQVLRRCLDPESRYIILGGSVGSGKTTLLCLAWALWVKSTAQVPNGVTLFMGRTMQSAYDNIVRTFQNEQLFGELARTVRVSPGQNSFTVFGEQVVMVSGNDVRAAEKLQGKNVKAIIGDEVATFDQSFFEQAIRRLRQGGNLKAFFSLNPRSPKHWLKVNYLDKIEVNDEEGKHPLREDGWRYYRMWMDDNPALKDEYKDNLRNSLSGKDYLRDVCGEWAADSGRVFQEFSEGKNLIKWEECPPIERMLAVGMDYGDTAPSAAVLLGLSYDHRLVVVDEFGYDAVKEGGQIAPTVLAEKFATWLVSPHLPEDHYPMEPEYILVDPGGGGTGFRNTLVQQPLMAPYASGIAPAPKKQGSVIDGIRLIRSLFTKGELVVTDRCQGLLREFDTYVWDEKAAERGESKPAGGNDHYCDALRYAVYTTRGLWQASLTLPDAVKVSPG